MSSTSFEYDCGFRFAIDILNGERLSDNLPEGIWSKEFLCGYTDGTARYINDIKSDVGRTLSELKEEIRKLQIEGKEIDKSDGCEFKHCPSCGNYSWIENDFEDRVMCTVCGSIFKKENIKNEQLKQNNQ